MLEHNLAGQCRELLELENDSADKTPNLFTPGSRCPQCGHAIRAWENIPVLSYLLQKGHCVHCGGKISARYPLVELLTAVLSVFIALKLGATWQTVFAIGLTWSLIALSFIDFDTQLLPDNLTLPLLWAGLIANLFGLFCSLNDAVIGAIAGYLVLWVVYQAFKLLTGKEGMGYGDFKLLAALGAWLGWQMIPVIILLAAVSGAVIGIFLIVAQGASREIPIPFGPYIAISGFIALFWGNRVIYTYMQYSGLAAVWRS